MEDNTLLNNFLKYCTAKLGNDEAIKTFADMVKYEGILICKDIIVNKLMTNGRSVDRFVKKFGIHITKFDYDNLPLNAVYHDKEIITNSDNIWFVDFCNFNMIVKNYNNPKKFKLDENLIKIQSMFMEFMRKNSGTFMLDKKYMTDELNEKTVKI